MQPALLTRLRPAGPWRYGPADGAHDRVDTLYRSDRLYSAVTLAMQRLGWLEEWLEATARAEKPAIAFTSLFPYQGDTLFAVPPATLWPPPPAQVTAPNAVFLAKIRWKAAVFVPLSVIDVLLTGASLQAEQWLPDPESGCLLRRDRPSSSPFRTALRRRLAVDRLANTSATAAAAACVEFEPGAGLWTLTRYLDKTVETAWNERIEAAFRLLADTGFGGRRTSGWGQAQAPEFERGAWPAVLLPKVGRLNGYRAGQTLENRENARHWLLSLYSPGPLDRVDWGSGEYEVTVRAGRVENGAGSGAEKKALRMIAEGSVLIATGELTGAAVDVAPNNFAHPVYRSGLALALELPRVSTPAAEDRKLDSKAVEQATGEEAAPELPGATGALDMPEPVAEAEPVVEEAVAEPVARAAEEPAIQAEAIVPDELIVEAEAEPLTEGHFEDAEATEAGDAAPTEGSVTDSVEAEPATQEEPIIEVGAEPIPGAPGERPRPASEEAENTGADAGKEPDDAL